MANRFFTILVVPEKTSQVRRLVVPAWILRGSLVGGLFLAVLTGIMILDYWYVMGQINENKHLKLENRRLRQQVQIFRNKMATIESTMDRVRVFTTRLKVITNIEDRGSSLQSLNAAQLPNSASNIGGTLKSPTAAHETPGTPPENSSATDTSTSTAAAAIQQQVAPPASAVVPANAFALPTDDSPEAATLRKEYEELDAEFSQLNHETLSVEQTLQDLYELLADQKAFLAALPTRKPAIGYFTSGFGVRRSPLGDRVKMHEGLDIANRPGTPIRATADGVVRYAETKPGYGQTVILDHGYGLETWYGHSKKLLVTKGQRVRRGEPIALLGNSGRSTGPHVHYEVRVNGTPVEPLSYILEN